MTSAPTDQLLVARDVVTHTDSTAWDRLVSGLGGQPFQSWAWGELKSRFGWQPHRIATSDGRAAAQVLIRPYRGLAVAYVPRGPILSGDSGADQALIDHALRLARAHRAAFLRFEPAALEDDPGVDELVSLLRFNRFRTSERTLQPRSTIWLDLGPAEDQLLAAFSKGHRADIRRAERDGVVVHSAGGDEAEVLHRMLSATRERKEFGFHSTAYWRRLMEAFGEASRLQIAERGGEPIAASLVLAWGRHGIYLAAGSTRAGLEHRAAHLLQWHAIRWARQRGAATWDLWGIADARGRHELALAAGQSTARELAALDAAARRDPLDGVYRFKKGWGGRVVRTLPAFDRVLIKPAYWFWQWRRGQA